MAGQAVAALGIVVPYALTLTTGSTLIMEIAAAVTVGGFLTAYLAMRAPRLPGPAAPPDLPQDDTDETEFATVPGAVTRTYSPRNTPSPAPATDRWKPPPPVIPDPTATPEPSPSSGRAAEAKPAGGGTPQESGKPAEELQEPIGLVQRMRQALGKSRAALQDRFDAILGRTVDSSALDELEEALLMADVGVTTATALVDKLRDALKKGAEGPELRQSLRAGILARLRDVHQPLNEADGLFVVLVVGVNGSGKTTTIGKLAARYVGEGKKVLLAAADTYRAAAADQLGIWAQRAGADLARLDEGADPGAVVYKAMERAIASGYDVVIIDTAGRLQTRKPLMDELSKLQRVIGKHADDAPHETLLVLDGTMGQNGLSQAKLFNEAAPLTGVVVTKLDGTAKGGMILTIAAELSLPVKLIGMGEGVDDLRDFDPEAFVDVLA